MTTAEKLVAARGKRSREEVAKAIGVSLSAVYQYETGVRVPRDEIKVRLADYFGASIQFLFLHDDVTNRVSLKTRAAAGAPRCVQSDLQSVNQNSQWLAGFSARKEGKA